MTTQGRQDSSGTVAKLRQRHTLLLQLTSSKNPKEIPKYEVLAFLDEVAAGGRSIASEQGRKTAEGILDFWVGRLLAQDRSSYRILSSYELDEYAGSQEEACDADAPEAAARNLEELKERAGKIKRTDLEGKAGRGMRVALLELFRIQQESRKPELFPLLKQSEVLRSRSVQDAVALLLKLGLISEVGEGESAGYVLAREELFEEWPALRKLVSDRVALLELANGWDKRKRKQGLLLDDPSQLADAASYPDLSKVEAAFVNESRDRVDRSARRKKSLGIFLWVMGTAVMIMLAIWSEHTLKQRDKLQDEMKKVDQLKKDLLALNNKKKDVERDLRTESMALKTAKDDLAAAQDRASINAWSSDLRLQEAESARRRIDEIAGTLSGVSGLPEKLTKLLPGQKTSLAGSRDLAGLIVELYVADAPDVEKATRFLDAMKRQGALSAWQGPVQMEGAPNVTEVRYSHEEDKGSAERVAECLKAIAFNKEMNIRFSPGKAVPKGLVIVSLSRGAAEPAKDGEVRLWVRSDNPGMAVEVPLKDETIWKWGAVAEAKRMTPAVWTGPRESSSAPWETKGKDGEARYFNDVDGFFYKSLEGGLSGDLGSIADPAREPGSILREAD